jgi:hypothetical protein
MSKNIYAVSAHVFLLLPFGGFNAELEGWLIRGPLPLREGKFDA